MSGSLDRGGPAGCRETGHRTTGGILDERPIGIFDSGLGGLTVTSSIIDLMPDESIIYYGDTGRFPYGTRGIDELRGFVFQIIEYLLEQDIKLVVIACNSGAAAGLEAAQARYDIPVIGVVEPGARAAVLATHTRRIGVIGTEATISSGAYTRAVHALDAGAQVFSQPCSALVDLVEAGELSGARLDETVRAGVAPLKEQGIDCLIMGCTHYPVVAGALAAEAGPDIKLISSAEETARELKLLLTERQQLCSPGGTPAYRFICSADAERFRELGDRFLGRPVDGVETVSLGDA